MRFRHCPREKRCWRDGNPAKLFGGMIAGRVRGLAEQLPAVKGWHAGDLAIATAMHHYARSGKGWSGVIKEIAGGMGICRE